jgi:hypothetical protein
MKTCRCDDCKTARKELVIAKEQLLPARPKSKQQKGQRRTLNMKSYEVRLNEALEHLKKTSESKFNEVSEKLTELFPNIKAQAYLAEEAAGFKEVDKASRTVPKYNGESHNSYFTESASTFTESSLSMGLGKPITSGDKLIAESMFERGEITAEQKRQLLGEEPPEVANLSEAKRESYRTARSFGISEADALRLTKII